MNVRTLQKLMRAYGGASAKWVIERLRVIAAVARHRGGCASSRRLRVIEAVHLLELDRDADLAVLAPRPPLARPDRNGYKGV